MLRFTCSLLYHNHQESLKFNEATDKLLKKRTSLPENDLEVLYLIAEDRKESNFSLEAVYTKRLTEIYPEFSSFYRETCNEGGVTSIVGYSKDDLRTEFRIPKTGEELQEAIHKAMNPAQLEESTEEDFMEAMKKLK